MAPQTPVEYLFLGYLRKRDDAAGGSETFNMIVAGAMAPFAARVFGRFFAGNNALVVGVLIKLIPDFVVAPFTSQSTHEFIAR